MGLEWAIGGEGHGTTCVSPEGSWEECRTVAVDGEAAAGYTLANKNLASSFVLKAANPFFKSNDLPVDPTGLTMVRVVPGTEEGWQWNPQFSLGISLLEFKMEGGGVTIGGGAGDGRVKVDTIKAKREVKAKTPRTPWQVTVEGGRISPQPANDLKPELNNPVASVPVGHSLPATWAVKGRVVYPLGRFTPSLEGGLGRGGPEVGDSGKSLLARLQYDFGGGKSLAAGWERTRAERPAESFVNQFFAGPGTTEVDGYYGRLDLAVIQLYGGFITHRLRIDLADDPLSTDEGGQERRIRKMRYGAAVLPMEDGWWIGALVGVQDFTRDYVGTTGVVLEPQSRVTTLEIGRRGDILAKKLGYEISGNLFHQQAQGSGIEEFENSGGFISGALKFGVGP